MITNDMLNQTITTIYSTSRDGYGAVTKTAVYTDVACRWQEKHELVLDASGNEQLSSIQCWLPTNIDGSTAVILVDYVFLFGGVEYQVIASSNHYNIMGEREYIKTYLK